MCQAGFDAAIIFFVPYISYNECKDIWTSTGYGDGIWVFGTIVYTILGIDAFKLIIFRYVDVIYVALVMAMFGRIANMTYTWTIWTHVCFWGSALLYVLFLATYQVSAVVYFS